MTQDDSLATSVTVPAAHVPIVVIGASSGGIAALRRLVAELPASLPAALMIVLHIGEHASRLPWLLSTVGPLPVAHAVNGEVITAGRIYVAPPDHHLIIDTDTIWLNRGPKEHHTRPAIDPMFRSAAISHGRRAVGIVLTGLLDDGTAGLQAIKKFGGITMVQDPKEAEEPSMPASALKYSIVDHCLPVERLAHQLIASVEEIRRQPHDGPLADRTRADAAAPDVIHEQAVTQGGGDPISHLEAVGRPSALVCPDCRGGLWEIIDAEPPRYRCHTGHGYTLRTLCASHSEATDDALWAAIRALKEKEMIQRRIAALALERQDASVVEASQTEADDASNQAAVLRKMVERG